MTTIQSRMVTLVGGESQDAGESDLVASPVHTIPVETLGSIFALSVLQPWVGGDAGQRVLDTRTVVILSHVCRFWRDVALSLATLWSTVDDRVPGRLAAFIQRSHHAPLRIQSRDLARTSMINLQHLSNDRLYLLDIASTSIRKLALTKMRVPRLECLLLEITTSWDMDSYTDLDKGEMILFPDPTPTLRALSMNHHALYRIAIGDCASTQFPNLAHLHLTASVFQPNSLEVSFMLSFLIKFPRLHTVHLSAANPVPLPALPSNARLREAAFRVTAKLARLRRLWFTGWHLPSALFLVSRLIVSPEAKIGFRRCIVHPDDILDPSFPFRVPTLPGNVDTVALALGKGLVHLTSHGAHGGLWLDASGPRRTPAGPLEQADTLWTPWMCDILSHGLARADIGTLRVHVEDVGRLHSLLSTMDCMPGVRALEMSGAGDAEFVVLVLELLYVLLPRLETLAVDFSDMDGSPLAYVQTLLQSAQGRGARGARLRSVVVRLASVREEDARQFERLCRALEKCVDEVEVLAGERYEPSRFAVDGRWTEDDHGYWEMPEEDRPVTDTPWMRWGK